MALFTRENLEKVIAGRKTQTRRTHRHEWCVGRTYSARCSRRERAQNHIHITRKFKDRLGNISLEDVQKEGFNNIWQFREAWEEIHGPGSWNPDRIVTAYEFRLVAKTLNTQG